MGEHRMPTLVADRPPLLAAVGFLDALAEQDYARLDAALAPQVRLRALLPGGTSEWTGAVVVADRFARWFGDTQRHDVVNRGVDAVAGRIHLCWRLRVRAERLGPGEFVVEQHAFADTDEHGRIAALDLLCTGYLPDGDHG